jgi:hypothetical protein
MVDYPKYKMFGGRILMKKGAIPHIFDCEPQVSKTNNTQSSSVLEDLNINKRVNSIYCY